MHCMFSDSRILSQLPLPLATNPHALEISTAPLPQSHGPMTSLPPSPFQGVGGGGRQGPVSWADSLGKGVVCQSCARLPPWLPVPHGVLPRVVPSRHKSGFVYKDKALALTPYLCPRLVSPASAEASVAANSLGGETDPWQGRPATGCEEGGERGRTKLLKVRTPSQIFWGRRVDNQWKKVKETLGSGS